MWQLCRAFRLKFTANVCFLTIVTFQIHTGSGAPGGVQSSCDAEQRRLQRHAQSGHDEGQHRNSSAAWDKRRIVWRSRYRWFCVYVLIRVRTMTERRHANEYLAVSRIVCSCRVIWAGNRGFSPERITCKSLDRADFLVFCFAFGWRQQNHNGSAFIQQCWPNVHQANRALLRS